MPRPDVRSNEKLPIVEIRFHRVMVRAAAPALHCCGASHVLRNGPWRLQT